MKGSLQYDILLIALGVVVPAAILAGPRLMKWRKAKIEKRLALEKKRDDTLDEVAKIVKEISGDVRCLYQVQMPELEALEISLLKIQGAELNGNVEDALTAVRGAKKTINHRLNDKVGCGDIGEGTD